MVKLTSTYNFARISKYVYIPERQDEVSVDHPFSDGEDGIIEVRLRNVSPLFTRDGTTEKYDKKKASPYSAHLLVEDGKRHYYLPATSIKGMLRTTMESLSFGKMSQYLNRSFGYRDFGGKQTQDDYLSKVADVRCGWLEKDGDDYTLTPCDGPLQTISIPEVNKMFAGYNDKKSAWDRNARLGFYPEITYEGEDYHLVATGKIDGKKVEYLFPAKTLAPFSVPADVAQAFDTIHDQTPGFEKFRERLERDRIAVFYIPDKDRKVRAIGMSKMVKYPREKSLEQILGDQQEATADHDLTETIFGYISRKGHESLRGRVHIGNAFSDMPLADNELEELQVGVLGQPKPSFYPLYLKQTKSPYKKYDNPDGLAGRKLYRIHRGGSVTQLPQGNDNENIRTKFRPVPAGQTFTLLITVHNMRPIETGALLSALTLHNTKGCYHNIGLAKGFGYGKLEILSVGLKSLSHDTDYYLRAFEQEMSSFTLTFGNKLWHEREEPLSLLRILSEHDDAELRMMELDDFREVSKIANFDVLKEPRVDIRSLLAPENIQMARQESERRKLEKLFKKLRLEYADALHNARELLLQDKLGEAKAAYADIDEKTTSIYNASLPEVEEALQEIKNRELQAEEKNRLVLEQEKQKKLDQGFDALINEKNLHGELKVKDFKVCKNKTEKWLRDNNRATLTDDEKQVFAKAIMRLRDNHPKKEDKVWGDKNSHLWTSVRQFLGADWQGEPL